MREYNLSSTKYAWEAYMDKQRNHNPQIVGSNPTPGTKRLKSFFIGHLQQNNLYIKAKRFLYIQIMQRPALKTYTAN